MLRCEQTSFDPDEVLRMTEIPGTTKVVADVWLQNQTGRVYQRPASSRDQRCMMQPLQKPSQGTMVGAVKPLRRAPGIGHGIRPIRANGSARLGIG